MALGANANATADQSVAIGAGSVADEVGTVSFGSAGNERRLVNVGPAVNGTDAVNLDQVRLEILAVNAGGAGVLQPLLDDIAALQTNDSNQDEDIDDLQASDLAQNDRLHAMQSGAPLFIGFFQTVFVERRALPYQPKLTPTRPPVERLTVEPPIPPLIQTFSLARATTAPEKTCSPR